MTETLAGNRCLFLIFLFLNSVLVLGACAILGLSIYLFILEGESDLFDWGFLIMGLYVGTLALSSFKLKRSPGWLWCYLFLLFVILAVMCVMVVWYFFARNSLVDDVAAAYAQKMDISVDTAKKILDKSLTSVGFVFMGCAGVVALTFAAGLCYRNSTIDRTDEHLNQEAIHKH